MTEKEIIELIKSSMSGGGWLFFEQFRVDTGYSFLSQRRIDLFVMNCWPSQKFKKIAYEVKTNRTDFLRDKKIVEKHLPILMFTDEFYYVAPKDIIKWHDVPDFAGLIEIDNNKLKKYKESPKRSVPGPTWGFVASFARRIENMEIKND